MTDGPQVQTGDEILIQESLAASSVAFDALMQRYEGLVFRIARTYVGQRADALDVCQDVFLTVHRKLHNFKKYCSFRAWLIRITRNQCLNWLRHKHRQPARLSWEDSGQPESSLLVPQTPETILLQKEQTGDLLLQLAKLNPRQGLALRLRYMENWSFREIAEALECREGQARNIACRGLKKLRHAMNPKGNTP